MITQERLKELLEYDPETGIFTNRVQRHLRGKIGEPTGKPNKLGYVFITLEKSTYHASRLAWLYMTGTWAEGDVDHINRNRSDNRWANLQVLSHQDNCIKREKDKKAA